MKTISFSHIAAPTAPDLISPAMHEFESLTGIHVEVHHLTWENAWTELTRSSIYQHGFDVSEIGTTWLSDFVSMNSLREFGPADLESLGGAGAFLEPLWKSTSLAGKPQTWAVPWLADTRFLYYRQDLLDRAGLQAEEAFASHPALLLALEKLAGTGVKSPLVLPTTKTRMTLHNAAAWVWGANGSFASEDGTKALFGSPQAVGALSRYFELGKFLAPDYHELNDTQSDALFWQGNAAVTISGPWLRLANPEVMHKAAITFPPGVPFIGGSNLVIWRHSQSYREALELVRFLTSKNAQEFYFSKGVLWPSRLDVLESNALSADPIRAFIVRGLQTGRSFRLIHLWGLIEERLTNTLEHIWRNIFADPKGDVYAIVKQQIGPLVKSINDVLLYQS